MMEVQKGIDELKHFSSTLKNACCLYESASDLLKYCLPRRPLKELIETLWHSEINTDERTEIQKIVNDVVQRIAANTATAVIVFAKETDTNVDLNTEETWSLYEKCSGEKLMAVLSNCLLLFYAVYDTRSIPRLFTADEVDEIERIFDAVNYLFDQMGSNGLKRKLPSAVLELYGQNASTDKEKTNGIFARKTFLFSTETVSTTKNDAKNTMAEFTVSVEKLVDKIAFHDFDIFEMRKLAEFELVGKVDFALFKKACSVLPIVQEIVDLRVTGEYLRVLRRIACGCNDWDTVMSYFYEKFREKNGSLKNFINFCQDFEKEMRILLRDLVDYDQLHTDQIRMKNAVDKCAWLLVISPTDTLVKLFLECLESIIIIPNVMRVLRKLPIYCNIKLETTLDEASGKNHKMPILMLALRHILANERASLKSLTIRKNFIYMCSALCRERRALLKEERKKAGKGENDGAGIPTTLYGEVIDSAVVDGTWVVNYLVLPGLNEVFYQEIVIEIGKKLFVSIGAKRTPIIWKAEEGVKLAAGVNKPLVISSSGASILRLTLAVLDILNDGNHAFIDLCQDFLRSLGGRLKEDGIIIESDTFNDFLKCFEKSAWTYRYALASWFDGCLISYKKEVPALLYNALTYEMRRKTRIMEIDVDVTDVSDRCLFRYLFELAVIHHDLALNIIGRGFVIPVNNPAHNISGALVDVMQKHSGLSSEKMQGFVKVLEALANQIDRVRTPVPFFTEISESTISGLRLIEPLMLIQEAVICAIHYGKKELTAVPFSVLEIENKPAVKLLLLFCEHSKWHMEREMIDLRRSHLKYKPQIKEPRPIPDGVVIKRETRVGTELAQLYLAAIMLSNHIVEVPICLKVLLVTLASFQMELGRVTFGPAFDEIITEAVRNNDGEKARNSTLLLDQQQNSTPYSDQPQAAANIGNDRSSSPASAVSNNLYETNKLNANRRNFGGSFVPRYPKIVERKQSFNEAEEVNYPVKKYESYPEKRSRKACYNSENNWTTPVCDEMKESKAQYSWTADTNTDDPWAVLVRDTPSRKSKQKRLVEVTKGMQKTASEIEQAVKKNQEAVNTDESADSSDEQQKEISWDVSESRDTQNAWGIDNRQQFREGYSRPTAGYSKNRNDGFFQFRNRDRQRDRCFGKIRPWRNDDQRRVFTRSVNKIDELPYTEANIQNRGKNWHRPTNDADSVGNQPTDVVGLTEEDTPTNRSSDFGNATLESIRSSFNPVYSERHPFSEPYIQNELFMAGTRLIDDASAAALVEKRFRNNYRKTGGQKPDRRRRGGLPPLTFGDGTEHAGDGRARVGERPSDERAYTQGSATGGHRNDGGGRRKNKKRR